MRFASCALLSLCAASAPDPATVLASIPFAGRGCPDNCAGAARSLVDLDERPVTVRSTVRDQLHAAGSEGRGHAVDCQLYGQVRTDRGHLRRFPADIGRGAPPPSAARADTWRSTAAPPADLGGAATPGLGRRT